MAEYTYKDIIIDPTSEEAKNAVGKECYMECSPQGVLYYANKGLGTHCLSEILENSVCPFFSEEKGEGCSCIIVKKEEPKPKHVQFQDGREFLNSYQSAESRLEKEDYFLSNHGIWLKAKDADNALFMVTEIWSYGVVFSCDMKTTEELEGEYLTITEPTTWEQLLMLYTFLDGSPCGKEVEDE